MDLHGPTLTGNKKKGNTNTSLYPLQELEALQIESDFEDSDLGEGVEELDTEEEAELEEEAAKYEEKRQSSGGRVERRSSRAVRRLMTPSAPPYEWRPPPTAPLAPRYEERLKPKAFSFLPEKVKRKLRLAYPVFEGDGERVYAPVEYNQIKELAESVRKYGVTANFTLSQLERLAMTAMTPADWQTVTKASLVSMGQYLEWKALWHEAA